MDVTSIDHLELYAQDAEATAARLSGGFGFEIAGRGGWPGGRSVLLRQGGITLVVTQPESGEHPAARYLERHGDGVAVVGLGVDDAAAAFATAVAGGLPAVAPARALEHGRHRAVFASVLAFGDVEHRFTSRTPASPFAPGALEESGPPGPAPMLQAVDHLAVCVPAGELDGTVARYRDVFGFGQIFEERIVVGAQAMDSKVVQSPSGGVTLTVIEPDVTRAPGQIDDFLAAHGGGGIQHVAFRTDDIAAAVRGSAAAGVGYLSTPAAYYAALPERVGDVGVPLPVLRELGILADRDHAGVLMQIFTRSEHPRRTLFWELIERRGARTFGSRNITALYEAVERQQFAEQVRTP